MNNVIRNLSNKLIKLELESNNSQRQVQQNRNFNPQYRRQPLQILQRERKDQDQIQASLYIEADPGEVLEHPRDHEDQISTLYAIDEDGLGVEGEEYEYAETIPFMMKIKLMNIGSNSLILCRQNYIRKMI